MLCHSIGDCVDGGLRQVGSEAERSLLTAFQQSLQEVQNVQHKYPPASYQVHVRRPRVSHTGRWNISGNVLRYVQVHHLAI